MSELLKCPMYMLYIDGKELDEFRYSMIQSITYEDNSTGSDLLTIELEDPEFIFINDNLFIEDKKVKLIAGYDNDLRTMFEGYIAVIDIDFPNTGSPTITLNCMDVTHIMNRVNKSRTWSNMTRGQVARQIFMEYGLKAVIKDTGTVQETLSQSKETDIAFLIKMAEDEVDPHLIYVEGNTGYYVKKEILSSPQATLDYRSGNMEILSFSPSINKETKQVEVRTSEVNLMDKNVDKGEANDNTPRNVQGTPVTSTDKNNSNEGSWKYNGKTWDKTY